MCKKYSKLKKYKNLDHVLIKKVDVSSERQIINFVKDVKRKFKKIHYLINNAGVLKPNKIEKLDLEGLEYSFKVNVMHLLYLQRLFQQL